MLLKPINDMKLNSNLEFTETLSTTTQTSLPLLATSSPPTPTGMFMPIVSSSLTTGLALSPPKYLPDMIGSTFATVSAVTQPTVN